MGVYHSFEKNETATMFFLKKPSLVCMYTVLGTASFLRSIVGAKIQSFCDQNYCQNMELRKEQSLFCGKKRYNILVNDLIRNNDVYLAKVDVILSLQMLSSHNE